MIMAKDGGERKKRKKRTTGGFEKSKNCKINRDVELRRAKKARWEEGTREGRFDNGNRRAGGKGKGKIIKLSIQE